MAKNYRLRVGKNYSRRLPRPLLSSLLSKQQDSHEFLSFITYPYK
jgi:hypothetical protein